MGLMQEAVTVTALNQYVATLMSHDEILSGIAVRGEISNCKRHPSGHIYFSLKDDSALLRCVMFRSYAAGAPFLLQDGMQIIAFGTVGVYQAAGQYQLNVRRVIRDGHGDLYAAFERLKAKLAAEGLFDETHKKPIPRYPQRVGVITATSGAAVQDICNVLTRRYPLASIAIYPALVQGGDAPRTLIAGLAYFTAHPVDVILIGRGGGSIEDLYCFNDEGLARAVWACPIPVISAVGHETDFTICDFVADLRAPTPSAAAELAVPDGRELAERLQHLKSRAVTALHTRARLAASRLARCTESPFMRTPKRLLAPYAARLARYAESSVLSSPRRLLDPRIASVNAAEVQLYESVTRRLERERGTLMLLAEKLQGLSPLAVMTRGYGVVTGERGESVRSVSDITVGDRLRIRLADGEALTTVQKLERRQINGHE